MKTHSTSTSMTTSGQTGVSGQSTAFAAHHHLAATPKVLSEAEVEHQMAKEEQMRSGLSRRKYIIPGPGGNGTF